MSTRGATGSARAMLQTKMEELQGFMAEHGDRVGQAFQVEMMKKLRGAFVGGDLVNIRNKLADIFTAVDAYSSSPQLSIVLNQMAIAIENKSLDNIPKIYRDALEKSGLTERYLKDEVFAGLHTEMARQVRGAQGTIQEAANQQTKQIQTAVDDLDDILNPLSGKVALKEYAEALTETKELSRSFLAQTYQNLVYILKQQLKWLKQFLHLLHTQETL